ncbi:11433_t:CDS:2 [Acaulospora morrowiae]|uniref:11433_t:CDS:1 n=1 Tax=Acaulospora morrowiae TaxID=94023 RepID=A0A9N9FPH8_9GLOM|nr:11433_t:CDS:2 [Acaulospora morrowiae]
MIANLLENTTAKDLEHIIKQVNAQTCYIPKKDNSNYKRLAILSFHNQEDRKQATNQNFQVKRHDVTWVDRAAKLCFHYCSHKHKSRNCLEKPIYNYNDITQYNQNYSRKYITTTYPNQLNPPLYLHKSSARSYAEIRKEVKLLDDRISDLETDTANRHFDEIEQMEEDSQSTTTETINIDNNSDLIEAQAQINQKINKMDETVEKLINTFIPDTLSTNSMHNAPTTLTQ